MMTTKTIKIFSSVEKLANHSADFIMKKINANTGNTKFSIALSGGSTPKKIYHYIAANYSGKINWKNVQFFFGDERCVPPKDDDSNFKMISNALLKDISIPNENVFRIRGENDPSKEAKRYGEIITNNLVQNNNLPQFDIVMLGLGEDGHTASIFPNQINIFNSNSICEVAVHPQSCQKRITLTGNIINNAKLIVFVVTGENKSNVISKILGANNSGTVLPASLVKSLNGKLIWLLDTEAAQLLDNEIKKACMII